VISATPPKLKLMSKLVLGAAAVLLVTGALWHGVTFEVFLRLWRNLIERPSGPVSFRFILQPAMAMIAATLDGVKDARRHRSPYFWTILHNPAERRTRLIEGLNATARIILLGLVMDAIYQAIVLEHFYPNEALIIAVTLAFVPYVLIRGPAERVARWYRGNDRSSVAEKPEGPPR
jgi:hypothetical protein